MRARAPLLCWLACFTPLAWLFGRLLVEQRIPNFRDIAHYYRPLWQWTSNEWASDRVPLWNSLDGLGIPVHADPTASLFYPGQLLFALPLDFTTRLNLYVVLHVVLALGTLYYAARRLGASLPGAIVGAMSYAYGGHVLFQYCNPIFLVGAAWLPLAIVSLHQMLVQRSLRWALVLAVTLALMTLGGDPQLAYHVLLIGGLYVWLLWRDSRRTDFPIRPSSDAAPVGNVSSSRTVARQEDRELEPAATVTRGRTGKSVLRRWLGQSRLVLLGAGALVALLLAAIQILPSAQWSSRSARAAFDQPRSVWEVGRYLVLVQTSQRVPQRSVTQDIAAGLFAAPQADVHHEHVYEFSVGPWRWLEFLWPNIGGKMFPLHQRWMTAIPAESRIWTPTLYLGLVPLFVACGAFALRRQADVTTRWLSWLVVIGLVGSLGVYGLGWLLHELTGGAEATKSIGAPVGGLYWFLVVLLPGYVQFRYPAKLMVLAALGVSLLAARGWEAFCQSESRCWPRLALGLSGLSALLLAIVVIGRVPLERWLQQVPPEFPFGPFDACGAWYGLVFSLAHTMLVALLLGGSFGLRKRLPPLSICLLLLTAIDLSVANGWLVSSSPRDLLPATDPAAPHLLPNGETAVRFYREPIPGMETFIATLSPSRERLDELLVWERGALAERWYLAENRNLLDAVTSLEPLDMQAALAVVRGNTSIDFARDTLAIDGALRPPAQFGGAINPAAQLLPPPVVITQPRAYLPKRLAVLRPLAVGTPASVEQRSRAVLVTERMAWMDQSLAILEETRAIHDFPHDVVPFDNDGATCRITRYEQQLVEVAVDTPGETLLVLADYYSPDWTAEVVDQVTDARQIAPIYRTNRVLRGVMVPAGKHLVIFRYRPTLFYMGLAISSIAWIALAMASVWLVVRRVRNPELVSLP